MEIGCAKLWILPYSAVWVWLVRALQLPSHKEETTPEFCATNSSGNKFSDFSSINITKLLYGHTYSTYAFIFVCTGSLLLSTGFLELQRVRGYSLTPWLWYLTEGLSLQWPLPLQSTGSREFRLQQLLHMGSAVVARGLQSMGSVVDCTGLGTLRHVGSSWTRDRTSVPCPARLILNHRATTNYYIFYTPQGTQFNLWDLKDE